VSCAEAVRIRTFSTLGSFSLAALSCALACADCPTPDWLSCFVLVSDPAVTHATISTNQSAIVVRGRRMALAHAPRTIRVRIPSAPG